MQADKRTLIRRVSLDLTGMPPSREEIRSFLEDDSEEAYASMVDRMLDKSGYGEHMARYWLDLVRFADSNGIHHDHFRDLSPYRDWVIRAFNDNLPYDEFVRYQLAGDLYDEPIRDPVGRFGISPTALDHRPGHHAAGREFLSQCYRPCHQRWHGIPWAHRAVRRLPRS